MAYESLIAYIESIVRTNYNEEITGANMQLVLKAIVNAVGASQFRGVANPATNPGTTEGFATYITGQAGNYSNFGLTVDPGELCILKWDGNSWVKETITPVISDVVARDYPGVPFLQVLNKARGATEDFITFLKKVNGFITPGIVVWSGTGFDFDYSLMIYVLNNQAFIIPSGSFTLDAADPTNDRIDVVAVDDNGDLVIVKGTPAAHPVKPVLNYSQLEVTYILVEAGSSDPGYDNLIIYNENTESTGSATDITADFDNLDYPKVGLKAVECATVQDGGLLSFLLPSESDFEGYRSLSLFLRLNTPLSSQARLYAQFYRGNDAVSDKIPFPIEVNFFGNYQFIALPMQNFTLSDTKFDTLQLEYAGPAYPLLHIDYLKLEAGAGIPASSEYLGWSFDALTVNGEVKTFIRSGENVYFKAKDGITLERFSDYYDGNVLEIGYSGGGGGAPIELTYSELMSAIGNAELIPGQAYILTDFQTRHYFIDLDAGLDYTTISGPGHTGNTEQLLLFAASATELHSHGRSLTHPDDIVGYDPAPDNWLNDFSFADSGTIISGFKGVIFFRHDTKKYVSSGFDFREVKVRRWKFQPGAYNAGTTYLKNQFVTYSGGIYISLRDSNTGNTPSSSPNYWKRCNTFESYPYLCFNSQDQYANAGDFVDVYTFSDYDFVRTSHFGPSYQTYSYETQMFPIPSILPNLHFITDFGGFDYTIENFNARDAILMESTFIVGIFNNVKISGLAMRNFGYGSMTDFTANHFESNIFIEGGSISGIVGVCRFNTIASSLGFINIAHLNGNILNGFLQQVVASDVYGNSFFSTVNNCSFTYFRENIVAAAIKHTTGHSVGVDFTGATHVAANYDTELLMNSSSAYKVRYIDGSGNLVIDDANA